MNEEEEFQKKLDAAFMIEAEEHLQAISSLLLDLEKTPACDAQTGMIESIFREAHSLKGAARSVNRGGIETICQRLESVFAAWKTQGLDASPLSFDSLNRDLNEIGALLGGAPAAGGPSPPQTREADGEASRTPVAPVEEAPPTAPAADHERPGAATIRIPTARLDSLVRQAEEMLGMKLTAGQRAIDLRDLHHSLEAWEREWTKANRQIRGLRRALAKEEPGMPDSLTTTLVEFLDWNHVYMKKLQARLSALAKTADQDRRAAAGMVDALLADSKKLIMLPFSTVLGLFPKLVRDLSRDLGKDVDLVMAGAETEIDKRILEEMKDPLIHLIRNAVDHGVEKPDIRLSQGKRAQAALRIAIEQVGTGKVQIVIADDGKGIDASALRAAAIRTGVITGESASRLDDEESVALMFQSGLSTSPIITEISGRGLGMAIVREKVEKLGGSIGVDTKRHSGTSFRMILPVTLATFKGLVVGLEGGTFVIPAANVERIHRVKREEIRTVENRETIALDGRTLALARLGAVLEIPAKADPEQSPHLLVVIVAAAEERIGFEVSAIMGEQEVLVKPLGQPLVRVRNIGGATILASGKAVPILNPADLIQSAKRSAATSRKEAETGAVEPANKSVLVAEDSITSRMLLKNILESAGYAVTTSVDGIDALTALKSGDFAALVSDVDMPRMNGFDLTARIRADKRMAELPVVLVTARESREDRERGIDVGANAYLVKSSFDQSNLLDVIGRLL